MTDGIQGEARPAPARRKRWAERLRSHRLLVAIIAVSALLRLVLVVQGGQYYFTDEGRFEHALNVVDELRRGNTVAALDTVLRNPAHPGFVLAALGPAAMQYAVSGLTSKPFERTRYVAALPMSLASLGVLLLIYGVARRGGAGREEAHVATLLAAGSNVMLYFSRHLVPYDVAMALALGALYLALRPDARARRLLLAGALGGAAFIVYNGYWTLVAAVGILGALAGGRGVPRFAGRLALLAGGGLVPVTMLLGGSYLVAGPGLVGRMTQFAGTIRQGWGPEGFSFIPAFLWSAEHGVLLLWIAAGIAAAMQWGPQGKETMPDDVMRPEVAAWWHRRGFTWSLTAAAILLLLAIDAAVFRAFFLYGRLVRQAVPFLCLAAGYALWRVVSEYRPRRAWIAAAAALWAVQVAYNFSFPLRQVFPLDLRLQLVRFDDMSYSWSVEGPPSEVPERDARFVALNMRGYPWPIRGPRAEPQGRLVLAFPHPMQWAPYRYEGLTPVERDVISRIDFRMRVIDTHWPR